MLYIIYALHMIHSTLFTKYYLNTACHPDTQLLVADMEARLTLIFFLLIIQKNCSCWWRTWKHGCILYALHLWRDSPRHLCHTQYTIYHTSYMTYNAAAGGGDSSTANTHFYFSFFDNKKNCSCWWWTWKHG